MKLILDSKLINRIESTRMNPNRQFSCYHCNRTCGRNDVRKIDGVYLCLICNKPVQVTDVATGEILQVGE